MASKVFCTQLDIFVEEKKMGSDSVYYFVTCYAEQLVKKTNKYWFTVVIAKTP